MDMSPMIPQNYLFSCELKANKDDHLQVDNDENEDYSSSRITQTPTSRSKHQESLKKKTPEVPSSIENIKAKLQASGEKGGSLPKAEAKFTYCVRNCSWMTDQETIQDLWQWRKSL
ncbi:Nucleophosmin [Galemys pyrenaicus]|uniref:Nucleophosmin n=1 Tax=Galemys pyrenaicus TaxID=202257 RepID=A0A8J6AHU3_GALPY|nr:Nucleophosmin [Galemys pyrenaicus]